MVWVHEIPGHVQGCPHRRGRDTCPVPGCPSTTPLPLRDGPAGHPCHACGKISRYEWSPVGIRACSAACLLAQRPSDTVHQAVLARHKATLDALAAQR